MRKQDLKRYILERFGQTDGDNLERAMSAFRGLLQIVEEYTKRRAMHLEARELLVEALEAV